MDAVSLLFTSIALYIAYIVWQSMRRPKNFPPGPDFVPLAGNAIQLRKEAAAAGGQHKVFEEWRKRYNSNVIGLKLGSQLAVVVFSYPLIKEIHLQEVFEGRPDNFFLRLRTMGTRRGIVCTDGKLWYEHRNFTMKQMRQVGYGRSQMEQHIEKETESLLNYIAEFRGSPVWPGALLSQSVINVLWAMTAGKRFECDDKRMVKLLDLMKRRAKLFDMSGGVLGQLPWLRFVAPEWTGYNLIKRFNVELNDFLMETINEHKATLSEDNAGSDFIYAYIQKMQQELSNSNENTTFNETELTMTILDFFIAGSHTTSTTIELALMNLVLRPDVQKLVHDEIVANAKHTVFPNLSAKAYYPYMDAFIMEVERLYQILPITGPRRAVWDTKLGDYSIPKDTMILIALEDVHMDREHWIDPDVFRPERFINAEGRTIKDEYFIPFGLGRRRCAGDALAKAVIFSILVTVCQKFELQLSEKEEDKPSLDLIPGITLSPKPYKIKFVERS